MRWMTKLNKKYILPSGILHSRIASHTVFKLKLLFKKKYNKNKVGICQLKLHPSIFYAIWYKCKKCKIFGMETNVLHTLRNS